MEVTLGSIEIREAVSMYIEKKLGKKVDSVVFQDSDYNELDAEISAECTLVDPDAPKEPTKEAAAPV